MVALAVGLEPTDEAADDPAVDIATSAVPSIEETAQLFENRLDPASLDAALIGLQAAEQANPGDVALRILHARAEAFWCDLHADAPQKLLAAHLEAGVQAAHDAVFLTSPAFARAAKRGLPLKDCLPALGLPGVEALYWLGEDQHRLAALHGLAALLLEAPDLRLIFGRVAELAPGTYYGGPYRHLSELSIALPYGWSEGLKLTAAALQQAILLGPGLLQNHLVIAQRWAVKAQDYGRFRDELRTISDAPEDLAPELWPENELAKRRARELSLQAFELFTRAAIAQAADGGLNR